eukprot:403376500
MFGSGSNQQQQQYANLFGGRASSANSLYGVAAPFQLNQQQQQKILYVPGVINNLATNPISQINFQQQQTQNKFIQRSPNNFAISPQTTSGGIQQSSYNLCLANKWASGNIGNIQLSDNALSNQIQSTQSQSNFSSNLAQIPDQSQKNISESHGHLGHLHRSSSNKNFSIMNQQNVYNQSNTNQYTDDQQEQYRTEQCSLRENKDNNEQIDRQNHYKSLQYQNNNIISYSEEQTGKLSTHTNQLLDSDFYEIANNNEENTNTHAIIKCANKPFDVYAWLQMNEAELIPDKSKSGKLSYRCPICKKALTRRENVKNHLISIHLKIKRHSCQICQKKFSERSNLLVHLRIHDKRQPYQCDICNKKFNSLGNMRDHEKRHIKSKQYFHMFKQFFNRSPFDILESNQSNLETSVIMDEGNFEQIKENKVECGIETEKEILGMVLFQKMPIDYYNNQIFNQVLYPTFSGPLDQINSSKQQLLANMNDPNYSHDITKLVEHFNTFVSEKFPSQNQIPAV